MRCALITHALKRVHAGNITALPLFTAKATRRRKTNDHCIPNNCDDEENIVKGLSGDVEKCLCASASTRGHFH